jgi:hypothetical protein
MWRLKELRSQVDARAMADGVEIFRLPVPGGLATDVAQVASGRRHSAFIFDEACKRLQLFRRRNPVHVHLLVILADELALLDQPGNEVDGPELSQKRRIEGDLVEPVDDLPRTS